MRYLRFVGLSLDAAIRSAATFTTNRQQFIAVPVRLLYRSAR